MKKRYFEKQELFSDPDWWEANIDEIPEADHTKVMVIYYYEDYRVGQDNTSKV